MRHSFDEEFKVAIRCERLVCKPFLSHRKIFLQFTKRFEQNLHVRMFFWILKITFWAPKSMESKSSISIQKGSFELENRSNLNQVIELYFRYSATKLGVLNQRRYRAPSLQALCLFLPSLPLIWFHSFCSLSFALGRKMSEMMMIMVPYQSASCCTSVPFEVTFEKNALEWPA